MHRAVLGMGYDVVNKDPTLAFTLRQELWQEHQRVINEGGIPEIRPKGQGFRIVDRVRPTEQAPTPADDHPAPPKGLQLPPGCQQFRRGQNLATPQLVKGLLPEVGVAWLSGQWGTFKTTTVIGGLHYAIMTGGVFAGAFQVRRPGAVVMFETDDPGAVNPCLEAAIQAAGYEGEELPHFSFEECPPLSKPESAGHLIAQVKQIDEFTRRTLGIPVVTVWFDSYSSCAGHTQSGENNDTVATQKVMGTLKRLARECNVLVGIIDHFGKVQSLGTSGSLGKENGADVVLVTLATKALGGDTEDTRLAVRKQRRGRSGTEVPFTPEIVDIGTDEDGDPVTGICLNWGEARKAQPQATLTDNDKLLDRALQETVDKMGFDTEDPEGKTVSAVNYEDVRDRYYELCPRGDGNDDQFAERRRKNFNNAIRRALSSRRFGKHDGQDREFLYRSAKKVEQ
jgi:hypothetical protein